MSHITARSSTARASRVVMKPETFTIQFPETPNDALSLQDAFAKYLSVKKKPRKVKRRKKRSAKKMETLRKKFLNCALSYMGVPYAKRYYKQDEPEYQSPLFLDCCGLVRRVMYDLQHDFGFRIGPWNQAYMYDTLWKNCSGPKDMKPGDLIFIRGIYNNPNKRPQKHNITHVEIYMGEGEKSLGARWQRGRVQIFDTYYFESTSYKIEEYIFKSLDPWLAGHCKSHCSEHKWKQRRVRPKNKYSIFNDQTQNGTSGASHSDHTNQVSSQIPINSSDSTLSNQETDRLEQVEEEQEEEGASDGDDLEEFEISKVRNTQNVVRASEKYDMVLEANEDAQAESVTVTLQEIAEDGNDDV